MGVRSQFDDEPKSLRRGEVQEERLGLLQEKHVKLLREFVEDLRDQRLRQHASDFKEDHIPYFDPLDGGIDARCLFLFEAPGRKAVESRFVSRNNPDESARTFFDLNKKAGLARSFTASWNIVPWYLGDGKRIRAAKAEDVREGLEHLWPLLERLKSLQIVVLGGRKAQRVRSDIQSKYSDLCVIDMWHPSPQSLNRKPTRREEIQQILEKVASEIS